MVVAAICAGMAVNSIEAKTPVDGRAPHRSVTILNDGGPEGTGASGSGRGLPNRPSYPRLDATQEDGDDAAAAPQVDELERARLTASERLWRSHHALIRGISSVIIALISWEVIGRVVITNKLEFAPLSAILVAFGRLWSAGELQRDITVSFTGLAGGFLIATIVGVCVGSLTGMSRALSEHLDPIINALYATPLVALSPILILSLGIGLASKVAIVFMMSVFPILINTAVGIRSTDEKLLEAARSFAATRLDLFYRVMLPSALPFIVAGLRLGVGRGLVGVFIGELFGANQGLGYLISVSDQSFDIPGMFVGVLILAVTGVVAVSFFEMLERRLAPWRNQPMKE